MKKPVLTSFIALLGYAVFTANAATPPTPQLQKADKPLVDLGSELGGSSSTSIPKQKPTAKPNQPMKPNASPKTGGAKAVSEPASKPAATSDKPLMAASWSYSGDTGPRHWHKLSEDYQLCQNGKNQSPIDLREKHGVGTIGLPELQVQYREVPLKVINTGKTLRVNYPLGSYIKVGNQRFELMHFDFHTPSEHMKEGFQYPMEVQMVHRDGDGHHVIISVIFQEGEYNEQLQTLLDHLPKEIDKQEIHRGASLNPVMFFPGNTDFYKYSGSLTTPPCHEGVSWMVFKNTIEASAEQIQMMNEVMGANARPVQAINARTLLKSWAEQLEAPPMYEYY